MGKLHGNIKFHINSVSIQLTLSIFLDFFQSKIIDDKSEDGALWSIDLWSTGPLIILIIKYPHVIEMGIFHNKGILSKNLYIYYLLFIYQTQYTQYFLRILNI